MRHEEYFNDQYTLVYTDERAILFKGYIKEKPEIHSMAKTKEELIKNLNTILVAAKELENARK